MNTMGFQQCDSPSMSEKKEQNYTAQFSDAYFLGKKEKKKRIR